MNAFGSRFGRSTASVSARWLIAIGSAVLATNALATVVTPTDLQGWVLGDGKGSATPSPAAITGTQPHAGNGSLELDISTSSQQPLAYHLFAAPIRFGDLVGSSMSFGFDWLLPVGTPASTSPTIRLLLSGLTGAGQVGRSDGSLGWYMNGAGTGAWTTSNFSMTSGDFFFRVGGVGQEDTATCASPTQSFDDRRQTLTQWAAACNGSALGVANIDNATVIGIEVDWGSFNTATTQSSFADLINYNIGSNSGNYNFEVRASAAVPEPDSLALMLLGLGLVVGTARTRRRRGAGRAQAA